ncbi:MAG: hypothetical protein II480_12405, partial [Bacteroidales bacterium]|nr:hypothetical protein [Bacteroidales bacterium]
AISVTMYMVIEIPFFHTVWLSIAIFDSVYNIRSNSCLEKIVEKKLQKNLVDSQKVFTFAPSN